MTLVAGVDSSTQSCKVVIRDADTGALVRSGRASHPDGTEVDPAAWWDALQQAVADAGGLDDVAAISIAAQQHGMVVLDLDGAIIRPALLWNDTRSAPAAHDLLAEVGAEDYAARTGVVPVASFTASKLRWLRDAEPANAARVAAVALPHDWLSWRLRGFGPADTSADGPADTNPLGPVLTALTTDRSDASGTAYWSPSTGEYDLDLFELALGHGAILPRVLGADEQAGVTSQRGGTDAVWLPAGIVVAAGAGDNAGAALGLGASAGDVIVSIGTSGTVFAVTDQPTTDTSGSVAGFASASADFLPLVATLNAARVLDSIAALLGVDYDELGRLALEAQPGAQGLVLQPYFAGERTPNLPEATASVFGMTLASTTRPNLARAAIEGMLCGLADGLDAVQSLHVSVTRILLIGGAAQNPAVRAIAAQVFAAPIVVPTPGEYVADGGAVQAAWALTGTRPTWAAAIAAEPNADFQPVIRTQYAAHATA